MALTDTRPEAGSGTVPTSAPTADRPAILLGSGDHKAIGVVYIVASLVFGVAGWVAMALWGGHQIGDQNFLSESAAATLASSSRLGLVLLVAVPLMLGLGTYIVPLQVGANTIAFPRAAAAALWTWLLSSLVFVVANCIDGGIGGGRPEAVSLGLLSIIGVVLAIVIGTVSVITTAIALRTPGLTLDRAPLFSWAMVVGGSVWVLTLPVLVANVLLIYVDHRYGAPSEYGVPAAQWEQLSWLTTQPQIFAFAIPGLGLVCDVLATLAGVRQAQRNLLLGFIGAFGVLSIGAWVQPYFYGDAQDELVFAAMAILILLPVLGLFGGWATTLRSGRPSLKSPIGLGIVSGLLLLLAAVAGVVYIITPLDLRETDVYSLGMFSLVMASVLAAGAAGVMYWAPKMTGRSPADAVGKLNVLVILGGGALAGLPLIVLGFATKYDGIADASDALFGISVAGDALLALGALLVLAALVTTSHGASVDADAWGTGQSLEWACPSPPPPGNFGELALVRSPEPLLDAAEPAEEA
ncbi:MAG TPA: cbb3-type cytochrome c oxidase subunit I [Acidimicrobiales bacterium]